MISIRTFAIVVTFGGLVLPQMVQSVEVVIPKPAVDPVQLLDLKLDWVIKTYQTAKRRALARHAAQFTGGVEDATVEKLMRRELSEMNDLSVRLQTMTESLSEAKVAINSIGKDHKLQRLEAERWHGVMDKAVKQLITELVRIEDRYDPIEAPRKPPLPPAALGQPLMDLTRRESMEVEKILRRAIYEPWQDFYVNRERQRGKELEQLKDRRLRSANLSVSMPHLSTRYNYNVFLRKGRAGDQGVDRVRGNILIERGGPIGDVGVLVTDKAKATFLHRPIKSPTVAIKSNLTLLLTQPLRLDLRSIPADSLLTRLKYERWAVQTPPVNVPDPPIANTSSGGEPRG